MIKDMFVYAARDPETGKLVSDITHPKKKFWQRKEAAVKAIRNATSGRYGRYDSLELITFKLVEVNDDETVADIADHLIAHGVTVQDVPDTNVGEWISVEDRLPEESGEYLCFTRTEKVLNLPFSAKHKAFNAFDCQSKTLIKCYKLECSHWMPLPQPPKGE